MAEYRLTPAAERDLESIWCYTLRQWGIVQADHYIDFLVAAFSELADASKIAPSCEHIRPGYRRWGVERHSVYFLKLTTESLLFGCCMIAWMRRATYNCNRRLPIHPKPFYENRDTPHPQKIVEIFPVY